MQRFLLVCSLGLGIALGALVQARPAYAGPPQEEAAALAHPLPAITRDRISQLEQKVAEARSSGDNAWMLASAALVLLMTGPGLALFYGGLVRRKNVLGTMMQSFALMAIVTVLWAIFGYSLCFDAGSPFLGGLHHVFLRGVGAAPDPSYAATVPSETYMIFQLMFAIITPALICGAFAERMKFSSMVVFTIFWTIIVYDPMAHMVWGKDGFLNASLGGRIPTLDFAGGTVVHITSGVSALVCALYLGKRIGFPEASMAPHNVVLSFIGACLLWVGWFGFNAGSALGATPLATSAFVATHFGAASAAIGWAGTEWIRNGKPSVLGAVSGAVAGLVAITPASGFVGPMSALAIGLAAGVGCYLMVAKVKAMFGYDDSLDAFGVHGAGGTIGALLTGVFATSAINPIFKDARGNPMPSGWIDGHPGQMLNQLAGVAISWALAAAGTWIILKVIDRVMGLRIEPEHEIQGLDVSQHGEEAYNFEV
jgi:ammonium transporter, Amt family